jgi:fructoselysine-6-P-deglycase FrlB-like protein
MTTSPQAQSGIALIEAEMRRQHADALASFAGAELSAARVAKSARLTGRLLLIGMGGSHYVNRMAEPVYRALGLDATAIVASEILAQPLADRPRSAILTSQSGASGEILQLLGRPPGQEARFGLTLGAESALAQALPSLIGVGGVERGFAATRSLLISLTLHAAVASALGQSPAEVLAMLRTPPSPSVDEAVAQLAGCRTFILSGRGELAGMAESGALVLMELARIAALALEGGQFRHGPFEVLAPDIGVVILRPAGPMAASAAALSRTCISAGIRPVIFDASGETAVPGTTTLAFPRLHGLAAAIGLLPALQQLLIRIAGQRVEQVGVPIRSTKVTGLE